MKVLVGVTGSVATVKLPELVRSLLALGVIRHSRHTPAH